MRRHARLTSTAERLWRGSLWAWAVYGVILVAVAGWRARDPYRGGSDFCAFYLTAKTLADCGRIEPDYRVFYYLPFFVVLTEPAALLPCWLSCSVFTAASLVLFASAMWLTYRGLLPDVAGGPALHVGVPALMVVPFVTACAVQGQVTLLIVFLLQLAWWLFAARGRRGWAGLPLAVAILIKPFLATVLVLFVWKRAWRTALSTLACMGLLGGGLTLVRLGPAEWARSHEAYWRRVVAGYSPLVAAAKPADPEARFRNQSLPVVLKRLLTRTDAGGDSGALFVNVADWPVRRVTIVYAAVVAAWFAALGWVARRPFRSTPIERWHCEFAVSIVSGLVVSPIIWTHYFPLMAYPLMLLTGRLVGDAAARRRSLAGGIVWWAWVAAAGSLATELVAPAWLRAAGVHLWASLLVGTALAGRAVRTTVPASDAPPR